MTTTLIIGLLIPLLGTMSGSAFVFLMKDEMSVRLQKSLKGPLSLCRCGLQATAFGARS